MLLSSGETVQRQADTLASGKNPIPITNREVAPWRHYRELNWSGASNDAIYYGRSSARCRLARKVTFGVDKPGLNVFIVCF
ncbi:unnamed protein product [Cylicostephanus goldi]|uniref:Uncharacterized protein n=1 Tax=Cylicostephanus goldi TaxID=71465 RepID=A0A3P6TCJ6_CYLGO|nr:unnamed protein product [Cylicostephanus goldi]